MRGCSPAIHGHTRFDLLDAHGNVREIGVELEYTCEDPYTVTMRFDGGARRKVEWVLDREMLIDGLAAPVGQGDIRLRPETTGALIIELISDTGAARLRTAPDDIAEFLRASTIAVPLGHEHEHIDIDSAIDDLLARWSDGC
ncbi:SsgA family sporulation/cell division regulator [Lentzea sp. NPDC006480]|uniref:SsgA family sporulation/cell division regulator n=1 Tax=Lentzea sp. NPDC006480 TaxID=3157176 RepID=UPI00339E6BAC